MALEYFFHYSLQFLDSTEVLPIQRVLEWGFQLGVRQFHTLWFKLPISNNLSAYCFSGQDNLLGGQFWAMGRLNLQGG